MSSPELLIPKVGVGAVVIKDEKILLVKRKNAPQQGEWAIPGGKVKLGETLQKAAEREILEETGLIIQAKDPIHAFDIIERSPEGKILVHFVIVDLKADYIQGEIHSADDASDAKWFNPSELKSLKMTKTTKTLVEKIGFI
jgi:8-oxo-dGTP diphosphatase